MLAEKVEGLLRTEVQKGCVPELASQPVALEPRYSHVLDLGDDIVNEETMYVPEELLPEATLVRLGVWLSPEQAFSWERSELFLKLLGQVHRRVAMEIVGNQDGIVLRFLCSRDDCPIVSTAFTSQFEQCLLSPPGDSQLDRILADEWAGVRFRDFYPPPPYSHLFTLPAELKRSPYATLMAALSTLRPPALGVYQVVFAPVAPQNDWHRNVRALLDLEFSAKLVGGVPGAQRLAQQMPSGDLKQMAFDLGVKAHDDKPFFSAALRIGVINGREQAMSQLEAMSLVAGLIQHSGRPLNWVAEDEYLRVLNPDAVSRMLRSGLTYRPGFLVNSLELASLVHLPPSEITECHREIVSILETLPPEEMLCEGTQIGSCSLADRSLPVCIPLGMRGLNTHLIGRPGQGKSSVLESMILDDTQRGHGVAVLDPHGLLVQRLLCLLPEAAVERTIYIDPGDRDWVPIWNPFRTRGTSDHSRLTDDLVRAFKSFITGWGDRLEHLLRQAIYAILHLPRGSLLDVMDILRKKSEESRRLRSLILKFVDNEVSRRFWQQDFDRYTSADLAPPQHKLSKLLMSGTAALMLSQTGASFDLNDVMDSGKILLVDLSRVGPGAREVLGCFFLSLLHLTAMGRSALNAKELASFHIYCDEAHRFVTDALEDLIAETRKFNVSLTLAHQYMKQFTVQQSDALSSVGSTIVFNVDRRDAHLLGKDLRGLVKVDELITLDVGQAIARVGNAVVRLRTRMPLDIPERHFRDEIIAASRERYYRRVEDVRKAIKSRGDRWFNPLPVPPPERAPHEEPEDGFGYDVF